MNEVRCDVGRKAAFKSVDTSVDLLIKSQYFHDYSNVYIFCSATVCCRITITEL